MHNTYLCKLVFQSRVSNLLHRDLLQGRKSLFIINFIFRVTVYDGLLQPAVQAFSSDAQMFLLSKASFVTIENVTCFANTSSLRDPCTHILSLGNLQWLFLKSFLFTSQTKTI